MAPAKAKKNITGLTLDELTELIPPMGYPKFRAKQIWQWLFKKNVDNFAGMKNLPPHLKNDLEKHFAPYPGLTLVDKQVSRYDKTAKFLFGLADGNLVESVLIKAPGRNTACISTQVGCSMGCTFCASTGPGFTRNLTTGEIVEQILQINRYLPANDRLNNIVYMGIGEPLLNYEHVMKSVTIITEPLGLDVSIRKITISTCGIIPGIKRLANEELKPRLAISLHQTNNINRSKIMPVNNKFSLHEVLNEVRNYCKTTKRHVTFEYMLIHDFNDSQDHALTLVKMCKDIPCSFNLIAYNPIPGSPWRPSLPTNCEKFKTTLISRGFSATLRTKKGDDIDAACGQLRVHTIKKSGS